LAIDGDEQRRDRQNTESHCGSTTNLFMNTTLLEYATIFGNESFWIAHQSVILLDPMKRAASARILRDHGTLNMDFNSIPRHKSESHESFDESFCSTHTGSLVPGTTMLRFGHSLTILESNVLSVLVKMYRRTGTCGSDARRKVPVRTWYWYKVSFLLSWYDQH
jgi:hypothetical protein